MRFCVLLVVLSSVSFGKQATELEVVQEALKSNPMIARSLCDRSADSLNLLKSKAGKIPVTVLSVEGKIIPIDSLNSDTVSSDNGHSTFFAGAETSVPVRGGGHFTGKVQGQTDRTMAMDSLIQRNTGLELAFKQPILKDGFRNDPLQLSIKLAESESAHAREKQLTVIKETISATRTAYWTLLEKQVAENLATSMVVTAKKIHAGERAKCSIGQATSFDTLSSKLAVSESEIALLEAQNETALARGALARLLNTPANTIEVDSTLPQIGSLPSKDQFLAKALRSEKSLFSLMMEKFRLQDQSARNELLPSLDASASYAFSREEQPTSSYKKNLTFGLIARYAIPSRIAKINRASVEVEKRRAEIDHSEEVTKLSLQIEELSRAWNADSVHSLLAVQTAEIADAKYKAALAGFSRGTIDQLTLQKSSDEYRTAKNRSIQTQIALKKIEIVVDELTESSLERFGIRIEK